VFGRVVVFKRRECVGLDFVFDLVKRHPVDELRGGHLPLQSVNIPDADISGELEKEVTLRAAS
jgi:hypothetical protein